MKRGTLRLIGIDASDGEREFVVVFKGSADCVLAAKQCHGCGPGDDGRGRITHGSGVAAQEMITEDHRKSLIHPGTPAGDAFVAVDEEAIVGPDEHGGRGENIVVVFL